MRTISKRFIALLLLVTTLFSIAGCADEVDYTDAIPLSFKSAATYDYLKTIDGQRVTINGYMATSSPVDGSFMFLMNLPYQSCPFCVPNTSQLSNTMEVYPKKNESFPYTTQAIRVVGTLQVAPSEDEFFTDEYGYEFNFKIVDASYTILRSDEISADLALWQRVAESDVISDVYAMYDYVNFLCAWNTYFVNSYTDKNGNKVNGYYLYPSDALRFIETDKAQWNYGYKEGYFDSIVKSIEDIDATELSELVENVRAAEQLAEYALNELKTGNYSAEYKYVEKFGTEDYVYTLINGEQMMQMMQELYSDFSEWLASWEM